MNFIQQASKGNNKWWMYLVTLSAMFIGMSFATLPMTIAEHFTDTNNLNKDGVNGLMNSGIDKNLFLALMIFTFMAGLFVLYLFVRYVHDRSFKSVITSRLKIDWKRFWFAFVLWGSIIVILSMIDIYLAPDNYTWNFNPIPFFTLLLVSFLLLPFQTSAEELVFRGYLMQGLGLLAKNRWFPLVVTSVAFGLLHGANPEVEKLGFGIMVFYIGTGFLYGITTLMDEGTEIALGLHASNNIIAAFLVTTDWTVFQTDALFIDTSEPSMDLYAYIPVFVLYPIMLIIFSKKYRWKNWKEKLTGKLEEPKLIDS